jgi:hypothetical protein
MVNDVGTGSNLLVRFSGALAGGLAFGLGLDEDALSVPSNSHCAVSIRRPKSSAKCGVSAANISGDDEVSDEQ